MKRTSSSNGYDWELRNNKVQRKGIFTARFMNALGSSDVWKQIETFMNQISWSKAWKEGRLQIFSSEWDNGQVFLRKWNLSPGSPCLFNSWWKFLIESKHQKKLLKSWCQLSISSSQYLNCMGEIHKWESFHIGVKSQNSDSDVENTYGGEQRNDSDASVDTDDVLNSISYLNDAEDDKHQDILYDASYRTAYEKTEGWVEPYEDDIEDNQETYEDWENSIIEKDYFVDSEVWKECKK